MKYKDVESWIYNKRIRAWSPKSMKDKYMDSWIYNEMFRVRSPEYLKISRCGILDI